MRIDTNQPSVPTCPECGFVGPHTPWCSRRGDAEAIKALLHAADLASATPNGVEYTLMRAALRDASPAVRRLLERVRQLQPAVSPPSARRQPAVSPPDAQAQGDKIEAALKQYQLQYTRDVNDSGLPLVDALTPPGDNDIGRGVQERHLLADHIWSALNPPKSTDAQAGEPTPPVSRCCPVCDRPYHTDEDECPRCRKRFASSIAAPAQVPPPADDALIAEAEALCAKATPGPWWQMIFPTGKSRSVYFGSPPYPFRICCADSLEDAAFIAASRELLPKLATALREARAADRAICEECTLMDQRKRIAELERDLVESRARAERWHRAWHLEFDAEIAEQKRRIAAEAALETARGEIARLQQESKDNYEQGQKKERQRCLRIVHNWCSAEGWDASFVADPVLSIESGEEPPGA